MRVRQREVRFNKSREGGLVERELRIRHRKVRFGERSVGGLRGKVAEVRQSEMEESGEKVFRIRLGGRLETITVYCLKGTVARDF